MGFVLKNTWDNKSIINSVMLVRLENVSKERFRITLITIAIEAMLTPFKNALTHDTFLCFSNTGYMKSTIKKDGRKIPSVASKLPEKPPKK